MSSTSLIQSVEYKSWLKSIKSRLYSAQIKAAVAVNSTLIEFYWHLGTDILEKQEKSQWGEGFLKQLSQDLMTEFPDLKGFSLRNLKYIRQWASFWQQSSIGQQAVAQLVSIPWGHNLVIVSKSQSAEEARFYVVKTLEHSWSRAVLVHQMESTLWHRDGKAISNFAIALPDSHSDLAQETLKDPYLFDFISLTDKHTERELENALTQHITQFLLELGTGFAYMGRQVPLQVGEREFFIDLLFYHTRLQCHIVIELKTNEFEPEHAGKLNFYIKAVDEQIKNDGDNPTIGLLLCKKRDRLVAEWALNNIHTPIGISEYQLTHELPVELQSKLPSIEQIEAELELELKSDDE